MKIEAYNQLEERLSLKQKQIMARNILKIEDAVIKERYILIKYISQTHKPGLLKWTGKRQKPDLFYTYLTLYSRDSRFDLELKTIESYENYLKKELERIKNYKIRDIIYWIEGYNCTLYQFGQIIKETEHFFTIQNYEYCCMSSIAKPTILRALINFPV
jgi:hypothetical protein